ncbi:MAG: carbohydrate ABC transporter permease [Epulopiscium sp.]|jgi:multiple sugar transport system permease protein|nr:carbohydrate ABC transporter permease [Candidatus Epulonipiscium sp.]
MNNKFVTILHRITVAIFLIVALFPIYWMLNTSLKTQGEVYSKVPTFLPNNPTLDNFNYLIFETPFMGALKNSLLIALVVTLLSILIAYPTAYSISRLKFKGRNSFAKLILFCYLLPSSVLYIPLYIFVSRVGLSDNIMGLMLIYPTFTLPYVAWILIPHISSIPYDIEEAALVDGCSKFKIMYQIIFPLTIPGVISTAIFAFAMCWGEYLYALVNITDTQAKTFPLIISGLIYGDLYPWGQIMAGSIIGCIPILIIYIASSRFLTGGATAGGVKG